MTDHAGLIERLDREAGYWAKVVHTVSGPALAQTLREAASAIASLVKERDEASTYAKNFLVSFVNRYCDPVEDWAPLPDLIGMLTQIDNASTVAGIFRRRAEAAEARCARLEEALTPSAATKAAYIGEFHIDLRRTDEVGEEYTEEVTVPWTTIKEIMAAIRARQALEEQG